MPKPLSSILRRGLLIVALACSLGYSARAQGPLTPSADAPRLALAELQRRSGGQVEVAWDEALNAPRFLSGDLSAGLDTPKRDDPEAIARAFFSAHRALYGLRDPDAELRLRSRATDALGFTHLRFDQHHQGVPVWGGQLMAHVAADGHLEAVNGEYYANLAVDTIPIISFADARQRALAELGDEEAVLRPERSRLVIYARDGKPALTWLVNLYSARVLGDWMIFVDAHDGSIRHRYNNLPFALERRTFTANNQRDLPGSLVCTEADPHCAAGDTDARAAHIHASLVYSYYKTVHGRDSYDNLGGVLTSTVHYDVAYNNAFWNGQQVVYGDGDGVTFAPLARALDIVAHELTHAVTQYTSDLIYEDQSGALNESLSDIFAAMVEFFATPAQADWLIGEDVYTPGTPGDALRSLSDPTQGVYNPTLPARGPGQPDHMSLYASLPLWIDQGGIHINSGIPNKAAYLLAQGGTFHGITVIGIGRGKMERIFYRAATLCLTPGANFASARACTIQAAKDLFGNASPEVASVRDAWAAVGIGAGSSQTKRTFLPSALHNGVDARAQGIYGRVTFRGAPAVGIPLALRLCTQATNGTVNCTTNATTTTDAQGIYRFVGRPATAPNQWYFVLYENPADTTKVAYWFGDAFALYTSDEARYGGSFDAADIALLNPPSPTTSGFPITFAWSRRNVTPPDLYDWELYTQSFVLVRLYILGLTGSSLTLTALPSGASYGTTYLWGVSANNADGTVASYYIRRITFSPSLLHIPAAPSPTEDIPRASLLTPEIIDRIQYERFVRKP